MFEEICLSFITFVNLSLCIVRDGGLTESIHSHVIGVQNYVTFFLFSFCHDCTDLFLDILIGQWCIVIIIIVNYSFQQIRIVFVFWGGHARLFMCHLKSVQKNPTTFEYVKISRHFMFN